MTTVRRHGMVIIILFKSCSTYFGSHIDDALFESKQAIGFCFPYRCWLCCLASSGSYE